ncbi:DUF3987 domain-containing protein [Bartonella krasnovii]|nr:DUF3987 domain-containing protein [Bartonella krasnovii]
MERKEYQTDRSFYLTAFNGNKPYTYDRIERGTIHISNATLSVIGAFNLHGLFPLFKPCTMEQIMTVYCNAFKCWSFPMNEKSVTGLIDRPIKGMGKLSRGLSFSL